jgi:hypothetical protein
MSYRKNEEHGKEFRRRRFGKTEADGKVWS